MLTWGEPAGLRRCLDEVMVPLFRARPVAGPGAGRGPAGQTIRRGRGWAAAALAHAPSWLPNDGTGWLGTTGSDLFRFRVGGQAVDQSPFRDHKRQFWALTRRRLSAT